MLNIQEPPKAVSSFALFQLAFRPFFLFAPLFALLGLVMWIMHYAGWYLSQSYWGPQTLHSHEMLYGFTVAIISGFLLTAAKTWTGLNTISGRPLIGLFLLWVAGRMAPWLSIPGAWVAIIDLSFLLVVSLALAIPVIKARQMRNFIFIPILLSLWFGNALMHAQQLGLTQSGLHIGLYLGVDLVILMIVVMGGRVIPFFTERGVGRPIQRILTLDVAAIISAIIYVIVHQTGFTGLPIALASLSALLIQGFRVITWHHKQIWKLPILWVLHVSYYWLLIGYALMAGAAWGYWSPFLALHALTIGGVSGMILGMIARVSLGHTGRLLAPPVLVVVGFLLISLSAAVRVFIPLILPELYSSTAVLSGILWIISMLCFVASYAGILIRPRIDGLTG